MTGDQVELGALLVLLHGADARFRSVQATYRIWRHDERLQEAFLADAEEQKRRGASISMIQIVGADDPEPPGREEQCGSGAMASRFAKSIMAASETATSPLPMGRCGGSGTNASGRLLVAKPTALSTGGLI